jgi:polyisoprenoid-binding protein YceI
MEEHFNENYMESAKFPKATFKGQIANLKDINFTKDGVYNATIEGDLTIHGVTKHITQKGTVEVAKGKIIAKAKFGVKPEDYNIIIPALVKEKIANPLDVSVDITYDPMK